MKLRIVTLLLATMVSLGSLAQEPSEEVSPRQWIKRYVGCRPSPGECVHSCPYGKAAWEKDSSLCDPSDFYEGLACYCFVRSEDERP